MNRLLKFIKQTLSTLDKIQHRKCLCPYMQKDSFGYVCTSSQCMKVKEQ